MPAWRGIVNQIRYGLIFRRSLDTDTVERTADALLGGRLFPHPPQRYVDALQQMLRAPGPADGLVEIPHDEDQFRDFARRLLTRLDELRPWPPSVSAE